MKKLYLIFRKRSILIFQQINCSHKWYNNYKWGRKS